MPPIAVTGATGNFGRLAITQMISDGVAPVDIVAIVRDETKGASLARLGVTLRVADYEDAESLVAAFSGVERVLFISGSDVGQREAQHGNVVSAAAEAGVAFIAYTSILGGTDSTLALAAEHALTERLLAASGMSTALLRNGWYVENYERAIAGALQTGELHGAAGDGVFNPAARADYAIAAARVVAGSGHEGAVYELGGDEAITMSDLAELIADVSGDDVDYVDHDEAEYATFLETAVGLPAPFAEILASTDTGIQAGQLGTTSGDLARLLGRPTTPLRSLLLTTIAQHAATS